MKKLLCGTLAAVAVLAMGASPVVATASAEAAHTADDWNLTRATVAYTEEGIRIDQTEKGIPDNHAIAILEVPFEDLNSFEIKFTISMNDRVDTGRRANDVWTAVNVMGVPAFFNWRNSEEYGWAKDSPGLVTRFLSYDGDLRVVTDVYQEGYKTAGDDASSITVDTWTCINASAGAAIEQDITLKFAWEASPEDASKSFYSMYINGNKISSSDELAFVDREVLFPENKLYLTVVMNTQGDEDNPSYAPENDLTSVLIKEINGVSMATATTPDNSEQEDSSVADSASTSEESSTSIAGIVQEEKKSGCGSVIGTSAITMLVALGACGFVLKKKED